MKYCNRPFEHMYVLPDGRVKICGWTDGTVGNLIEQSVDEIWHGEKAERQREAIKNGSFSYCRKMSCPYLENDSLPDLDIDEFEKKTQVLDAPIDFSVACDYVCNHSCPSCREKIFVGSDEYTKNVTIMIDKLLPYLEKADYVLTDGNGDAFASPSIMRMLQNLHPSERKTRIGIETNGVLFDEEHWEKIKHLGEHHLTVTVTPNSFVPGTFKYLNGGHNTYDKIIHNLYFMKSLREQGIINDLNISIVVQDRNFMELPDFAKRCIEDFGADQVVVKPLYHWFGLSEDLYWHKDILNPMHPYHKEYMEVLKHPYLQHEKVYFWGAKNLHPAVPHPAYKYLEQLDIVTKCMEDTEIKGKLKKYFDERNIKSLYIYGDEKLSSFLYNLLSNVSDIKGFIARDICRNDICGVQVKCIWDYVPSEEDNMLIINYKYFDVIRKDFDVIGFKGKLIPLDEFIKDIFNN